MKGGILALFMFAFLVFAGCQRVEVLAQQKCTQVVGVKTYVDSFLGLRFVPTDYYVLEDGRLLDRFAYYYTIEGEFYVDGKYEPYCETEYVPVKNTKPVNFRPGSIGVPCPKEKCPERYDKNTGLPIPSPSVPIN